MENNLFLKDKTILLTRAASQQGEARRLFRGLGARVLDLPSLIIGPPDQWDQLDDALEDLVNFHWIIFSSSNGVEYVEKRLREKNSSLSNSPKSLKFAVVGRKTACSLEKVGIKADFVPPDFVAESLINNFPISGAGLRMLIPRVQSGGRTILAESFREAGADVVEVPAYESSCPTNIPKLTAEAIANYEVDAITFTSSKTVINTFKLIENYFSNDWPEKLRLVKLISIGPQTSLTCKKYFQRIDKEAEDYDVKGLVNACLITIGEVENN